LNGREGKDEEAYKQGEVLTEQAMLFKHSKMKADLTSRNEKTQVEVRNYFRLTTLSLNFIF
jgi:hypothetical protein